MNPQAIAILVQAGLDLALVVVKNMPANATVADVIAELSKSKTAQQYVDEDAAARGAQPVPLPPQ